MERVYNIKNGWKNYLKSENNQLAKQRAKHCKKCPFAVVGMLERFLPDYSIEEIQGLKCNKCGCPLSAKLRSENEKCPIGNW